MTETPDKTTLRNDIANIEEKRQVLEQIVTITRAIEHMQEGLNSVLVLGVSSADMPQEALHLYSTVSDNLRSLPITKIKEYLRNLEKLVKAQLEKILRFAGVDFNAESSADLLQAADANTQKTPLQLLEDFKRTAQTTVSLRVLLRKRGVATAGSVLPVSKKLIREQMEYLQVQETQQRRKAKLKIVEMQEDIARMIDNPAYPDAMKQMLAEVQHNLRLDVQALAAGAPLGSLSFVADADELTGLGQAREDMEIEEIEAAPAPGAEREVGFSEAASRWLNSPWDVSWDKIKHQG